MTQEPGTKNPGLTVAPPLIVVVKLPSVVHGPGAPPAGCRRTSLSAKSTVTAFALRLCSSSWTPQIADADWLTAPTAPVAARADAAMRVLSFIVVFLSGGSRRGRRRGARRPRGGGMGLDVEVDGG